ncbi:MAG: redoxin domain-containing protein [Acidobacteria bacterium]|nr:redoxin domain-containing protein [Acidobacteriota bacterium]
MSGRLVSRRQALAACLVPWVVGRRALAEPAKPLVTLAPADYAKKVLAPAKGKPLVVNFWATWCEPCREEMPALQALFDETDPKDAGFVLVSVDSPKVGPKAVPKFLEKTKVTIPCFLVASPDPQTFIDSVDESWDGSVPFTLVYSAKGMRVARLVGSQTKADFAAALAKAKG